MRAIRFLAMAMALGGAPAAYADPLCDAVKNAVAVGMADKSFASLATHTPSPKGFKCEVLVEGNHGFYACEAGVEPPAGLARASATLDRLKQCLAVEPDTQITPNAVKASFVMRQSPEVRVVIDAEDYAKRVYLNVVAF